jgi:hypothetical protein
MANVPALRRTIETIAGRCSTFPGTAFTREGMRLPHTHPKPVRLTERRLSWVFMFPGRS